MSRTTPFVFDDIADAYDATRALRPEIMEKVVDALSSEIDGTLLDVGVGTGRYAVPLSRRGIDVTGIDLSVKMTAQARAKGFHRVVLGDVARMPFKNGAFDSGTMIHVLHLILGWKGAVREIARVLRGSLYTVASYRKPSLWSRNDYIQRVDDLGFGPAFPGLHEWEMADVIKPEKEKVICIYNEELEADMLMGHIERREYSWATILPDREHAQAIRELKEKWAGKTHRIETTLKVLGWGKGALESVG
ncbi:MAG: methyltransferase domain-containing protein [Euryarchaeota archaeon]|nr:methyltransferase domain-containing protein [Euryarchaeota archaeon]